MDIQHHSWEEELINDIFVVAGKDRILSIPIPLGNHDDKMIWCADEKGNYFVKSAYKKLQGEFTNVHTITLLLKEFLPILVVFCVLRSKSSRQYESSTVVSSHVSSLDIPSSCMFLYVAWNIWKERNNRIWKGIKAVFGVILEEAKRFLEAWQHLQQRPPPPLVVCAPLKWKKLPYSWLKLNMYVALDTNAKITACGCILRDSEGKSVAARSFSWPGLLQVKVAEVVALRDALCWAKERGVTPIQVESDSQLVMQGLKLSNSTSAFDLILKDILELASVIPNVSFKFVKRSVNSVAHLLARGVFNAGCRERDCSPPSFILDLLLVDALE
nr:uncharacterized protein LOC109153501 [Ipomoea batatas]